MQSLLINLIFAACLTEGVVSFLLDGQPGSNQEFTRELLKVENEVSVLKEMLINLQPSCHSCSSSSILPTPALMVNLLNGITGCTSDASVIFDHKLLDTRQAYDVRHGIFRAPINGTYTFSLTLSTTAGVHAKIVLNSVANQIGYLVVDISAGKAWGQGSTTIVTKLAAGDDVWITCSHLGISAIEGGHEGNMHSFFSGFFVN